MGQHHVVHKEVAPVVLLNVIDDLLAGFGICAVDDVDVNAGADAVLRMQIASPLLLPTGRKSSSNIVPVTLELVVLIGYLTLYVVPESGFRNPRFDLFLVTTATFFTSQQQSTSPVNCGFSDP
jgi:hypothetical protein